MKVIFLSENLVTAINLLKSLNPLLFCLYKHAPLMRPLQVLLAKNKKKQKQKTNEKLENKS